MEENFYNNPLKVVWKAKKNLMPIYILVLWFVIFGVTLIGSLCLNIIDFSSYKIGTYFSVSSTGLTLTLALFVAGKNAFKEEELKILANHKDCNGVKGQALIDFMGPYVFSAILFLLTGIVSMLGPFIQIPLKPQHLELIKVIYINILILGLLSLFNLVITMINDVYISAFRK